jgi:hypothetical protein
MPGGPITDAPRAQASLPKGHATSGIVGEQAKVKKGLIAKAMELSRYNLNDVCGQSHNRGWLIQ